jgi:hypothetical protein
MDHIIKNLQTEDSQLEEQIKSLQSRRTKLQTAMAALTDYPQTGTQTGTLSAAPTVTPTTTVIEVTMKPTTEETNPVEEPRKSIRPNYGICHAFEHMFRVWLTDGKGIQYASVYSILRDRYRFTKLTQTAFESELNRHVSMGNIKRVANGAQVLFANAKKTSWFDETKRIEAIRNNVLSRMKRS